MNKLKYLFQPITIGSMEVKNRVMMSGMGIGFGVDKEYCVTSQLREYFVERAKARPGMIVVGGSPVHPLGFSDPGLPGLWDRKFIPPLKEMVEAIHNYDVKLGIQLFHGGAQSYLKNTVAPSAVPPLAVLTTVPKALSTDEVSELVKDFGRAAQHCEEAGFDFLELHAAHGYLINEFLAPYFNRRIDEYGGDFDNRIRFLLEIIREIRKVTGDRLPVGVKLNGDDFIKEGGWTLPDNVRLAPILEKEGVAYLIFSAGVYGAYHITIPSMYEDQGVFVHLAEEIKRHVSIPVGTVGRIKDVVMANRIIREGKADIAIMGRAHIADPEIVEKARKGELADIRPCIADCRGCIDSMFRAEKSEAEPTGASCTVNPRMGREYVLKDIPDEKKANPKKVLVVGAGPAGLEAARRAAFAGHKVTLCESRGRIGGQLKLAAMMPKRCEIQDVIPWYERQLNKLGVEIRLNVTVDSNLLDQLGPDVVVLATGSLPEVPLGFIQGLENVKNLELMMVDELIEEKRLTGDNVLVIGGDQIGLQVADYLVENVENVYVVERSAHYAEKMAANDRFYLIGRVIGEGVKRNKNVRKVEILPGDEVWVVTGERREKLPEIDTIVFASDRRPNIFLAEIAKEKGIETHIIGDASGVDGEDQGTVFASITAGYEAGRRI